MATEQITVDETRTEVDEARLEQFLGQAVTDMGAALNGVLVMVGGELGLWRAMHDAGPLTAAKLAERSGVAERYVREWLSAQAASGYVDYDAGSDTFTLPPSRRWRSRTRTAPSICWGATT